jgi:hypothetical protein
MLTTPCHRKRQRMDVKLEGEEDVDGPPEREGRREVKFTGNRLGVAYTSGFWSCFWGCQSVALCVGACENGDRCYLV